MPEEEWIVPEKYINYDEIRRLLAGKEDKDIYCFGAKGMCALMRDISNQGFTVKGFLDNDERIQGKQLEEFKVFSPCILENINLDSVFILISAMLVTQVKEQLEKMGMVEEVHFANIYSFIKNYIHIKRNEERALLYLKHLDTIPKGYFDDIESQETHIGIICNAVFERYRPWYAIEQCLIMRSNGYRCLCIVDDLAGFDDYIYFEGDKEIALSYVKKAIAKVKEILPDFEVAYLSEATEKIQLTECEKEKCKEYAYEVIKWMNSRKENSFLKDNSDREEIAEKILADNYSIMKAFFRNSDIELINVPTAAHKHRCLYKLLADEMKIRLVSHDGGLEKIGYYTFCSDGISSHHCDIGRMINESWFSEEEEKKLICLAKDDYVKRINGVKGDKEYNMQLVKMEEIDKVYDIIIPLNVSWDAAALFQNKLFENDMVWLIETVEYIMKNTDCKVMIREHPAIVDISRYNHPSMEPLIQKFSRYGERVYVCKANEKLNTYSHIKHCKLVLPYSSTVGLESTVMGKKILIHTECYYSNIGISENIETKEEYFKLIQYYLTHDYTISDEAKKKALLALFYLKNDYLETTFTDCMSGWIEKSWSDVLKLEGVEEIIKVMINNVPILYGNLMSWIS